jgi:hypothetical protein
MAGQRTLPVPSRAFCQRPLGSAPHGQHMLVCAAADGDAGPPDRAHNSHGFTPPIPRSETHDCPRAHHDPPCMRYYIRAIFVGTAARWTKEQQQTRSRPAVDAKVAANTDGVEGKALEPSFKATTPSHAKGRRNTSDIVLRQQASALEMPQRGGHLTRAYYIVRWAYYIVRRHLHYIVRRASAAERRRRP